jgi:hypothetical protein
MGTALQNLPVNWTLSVFAALLILPARTVSPGEHAHGTLIIVSATSAAIVIAADSSLVVRGKVVSTKEQKIFPLNRDGACFLGGSVRLAFLGTAERVDFVQMVRKWITQHPHTAVREAHQTLTALMLKELAPVRVPHPELHSTVFLGCVGFDGDRAGFLGSEFYPQTDSEPRVTKTDATLWPGLVAPMDRAKVAAEMLRGNAIALQSFKSEPIVTKYRRAMAEGTRALLTKRDLLALSSACLQATETRVGQEFDPEAVEVAGPNHFAVIDRKRGFRWVSPETSLRRD